MLAFPSFWCLSAVLVILELVHATLQSLPPPSYHLLFFHLLSVCQGLRLKVPGAEIRNLTHPTQVGCLPWKKNFQNTTVKEASEGFIRGRYRMHSCELWVLKEMRHNAVVDWGIFMCFGKGKSVSNIIYSLSLSGGGPQPTPMRWWSIPWEIPTCGSSMVKDYWLVKWNRQTQLHLKRSCPGLLFQE